MKNALAVIALVTLAAPAAGAGQGDWLPAASDVARVEAVVRLPQGAKPPADYARYYTGIVADANQHPGTVPSGTKLIWAEYVLPQASTAPPGVHILPYAKMPLIADGGCSVVNIYFDVKAARVVFVQCNGFA